MIKCSQAETSEDFEKNKTDLFEFQFIYGSWQEWKPLKRVQTLKIKKISRFFTAFVWKLLHDNYHLLYSFVTSCLAFCRN